MADKLLTIDQLLELLDKYNHRELHVHHTWKPRHSNFNGSNYQKVQDGMRNSHKQRGFNDIAQHVSLFPNGMFMTGRAFNVNPASILNHNYGLPFCVEMIGDFDKGQDKFEGEQKAAMLKLAKYFINRGKYVRFHRENAPKTCPGTSIDKDVFMKEAKAFTDNGKKIEVIAKPSTPDRSASTILEFGDKGEKVKELQTKLNDKGFNVGTVDGHFGKLTEAALIAFQKAAKIGVDGIYGKITEKALNEYKKPEPVKPEPAPKATKPEPVKVAPKPAPEKEESVQILTGGLSEVMVVEVTEYFKDRNWWAKIQFTTDGKNPRALSGGLDPQMRAEFEGWLKERKWYYEVLKK